MVSFHNRGTVQLGQRIAWSVGLKETTVNITPWTQQNVSHHLGFSGLSKCSEGDLNKCISTLCRYKTSTDTFFYRHKNVNVFPPGKSWLMLAKFVFSVSQKHAHSLPAPATWLVDTNTKSERKWNAALAQNGERLLPDSRFFIHRWEHTPGQPKHLVLTWSGRDCWCPGDRCRAGSRRSS